MDSTNCKPKIAIIYASVTGNTETAAKTLLEICQAKGLETRLWPIKDFPVAELSRCDIVLVGTYTWGSGEIPKEMHGLFQLFEAFCRKELVTAVFGTGDSFFAEFCGAVDRFRDMLFVQTDLAAVLKIELRPQDQDRLRCEKLIDCAIQRLLNNSRRV